MVNVVEEGLCRNADDDKRFVEAVNVGLAAAERGEFVEHDEVGNKLDQILDVGAST